MVTPISGGVERGGPDLAVKSLSLGKCPICILWVSAVSLLQGRNWLCLVDSQCILAVEFLVQTKTQYGSLIHTTDEVRTAVREKALGTSHWASPHPRAVGCLSGIHLPPQSL